MVIFRFGFCLNLFCSSGLLDFTAFSTDEKKMETIFFLETVSCFLAVSSLCSCVPR